MSGKGPMGRLERCRVDSSEVEGRALRNVFVDEDIEK